MRRILSLSAIMPLLLAVAACGGAGATPAASRAPSAPAAASAATGGSPAAAAGAVAIVDFAFNPGDVSVKVGTKVTWTNNGAVPHSVKSDDGTAESSHLNTGDTYDRTFDTAGTFAYVCGIHAPMKGTITVTQ